MALGCGHARCDRHTRGNAALKNDGPWLWGNRDSGGARDSPPMVERSGVPAIARAVRFGPRTLTAYVPTGLGVDVQRGYAPPTTRAVDEIAATRRP
jgi:hypothetical protein